MTNANRSLYGFSLCTLAAFTMAYGWGYRGTVGFEGGAMVPGALLGLVLSLGSGRLDWRRRAAVAGLFAAIGWAWGGSLSYMEQTLYVLSDSFPDVLYGYAMLFFLGALWAGIGGGVLGLAFTERRSELERLIRPFTLVCAGFLAEYLYFFLFPARTDAYVTLTVSQFHDTVWLAAAIALVVSAAYWLLRPKDRPGTALLFWGAAAWWLGYLGFTKLGGLRLAPLHRSEGWGGLVGVLVVLIVYLIRRKNRAALLLCLYGILGGGLAFPLAVFIRHPIVAQWGLLKGTSWPHWRTAEDSFGFFMGLAIALGVRRLLHGGLTPPDDDTPRATLDVYAAFVILIAINWINFRHHAGPSLAHAAVAVAAPLLGIPVWAWLTFGGALVTLPLLYILSRYLHGDRQLAPQSAFGKGVVLALLLMWVTMAGYSIQAASAAPNAGGELLLWIPAAVASLLLLSFSRSAPSVTVPANLDAAPSHPKWRVGTRYWLLWASVPVFLLCITALSLAMQNGPVEGMGRKRFGPDAYWRQTARLAGTWQAIGMVRGMHDTEILTGNLPLQRLIFAPDRGVTTIPASGATENTGQWFLKNQYIWLRWRAKAANPAGRADIPLEFLGQRLYVAWPPDRQGQGFLVFERSGP